MTSFKSLLYPNRSFVAIQIGSKTVKGQIANTVPNRKTCDLRVGLFAQQKKIQSVCKIYKSEPQRDWFAIKVYLTLAIGAKSTKPQPFLNRLCLFQNDLV